MNANLDLSGVLDKTDIKNIIWALEYISDCSSSLHSSGKGNALYATVQKLKNHFETVTE
jgi:hypothetical protein